MEHGIVCSLKVATTTKFRLMHRYLRTRPRIIKINRSSWSSFAIARHSSARARHLIHFHCKTQSASVPPSSLPSNLSSYLHVRYLRTMSTPADIVRIPVDAAAPLADVSLSDDKASLSSGLNELSKEGKLAHASTDTQSVYAVPAPDAVRQRWYQYFSPTDTPAERKLILKLDATIMVFVFLAYWAKTLDSSATSTAYVSGMKEDLNLYGNQLNYLNTSFQ